MTTTPERQRQIRRAYEDVSTATLSEFDKGRLELLLSNPLDSAPQQRVPLDVVTLVLREAEGGGLEIVCDDFVVRRVNG